MDTIYRAGIIGTGRISRDHTRGYNACERVQVVAGADIDEENLREYGKKFKTENLYTDYVEMVKKENLDIVSVCTYPHTHCEIVASAASYVKGIMCEKPMAMNLREADRMIEACDNAGTKLAIGHQRRYSVQHVRACQLLQKGEIGELRFVWASSPPPMVGWGTHVADLLRYYLGDVKSVMGQIDRSSKRPRSIQGEYSEDLAQAYLKFKSGLRCLLETESNRSCINFFGEEGEIEVKVDGGLRVKRKGSAQWDYHELQHVNPFKLEMQELVACIAEDREHFSSGREGRSALEILMAVFESSRQRKIINLPLEEKESPLELMVKEGEI